MFRPTDLYLTCTVNLIIADTLHGGFITNAWTETKDEERTIGQMLFKQSNTTMIIQRSGQNWNSYSLTFVKILIFMLQSCIFLINNVTENDIINQILSGSIIFLERINLHLLPLIWVLTHKQIRSYFIHKLKQYKTNIFN